MGGDSILKFAPFQSSIDAGFWHHFTKIKLEELKLSDKPIRIRGSYTNTDAPGLPPRVSVEYNALQSARDIHPRRNTFLASGLLINTNTIEQFKGQDKVALLRNTVAVGLWQNIIKGYALTKPSNLVSFLVFTFCDIKKHHYYYWFGYPAFQFPPQSIVQIQPPRPLNKRLSSAQITELLNAYDNRSPDVDPAFFVLTAVPHVSEEVRGFLFKFHPLTEYAAQREKVKSIAGAKIWLGFSDPSTLLNNPGWPLRNLLTLASVTWKELTEHKILCLRERTRDGVRSAGHSLLLNIKLPRIDHVPPEAPSALGWEKNERGNMGPKFLNLSATMDPTRLAESAVDLNLKLMRWRVAPDLELNIIRETRCLLLGAGTLGCNVARCLLGWGITAITFVDNGKVSYSNPVRQSLYCFEDCQGDGRDKATAAAEALLKIYPRCRARGVVSSIPMPGHTVGASQMQTVKESVAQLEQLIDEHDVIFLLTDSRESRWLPTLLGMAKSKIVLTAALGFDSFLVMRHGCRKVDSHYYSTPEGGEASESNGALLLASLPIPLDAEISGENLGCYFCNDVVAPGDSISDRTLDQQCTVTRPGMSMMAAAHVVELLVTLLQHPLRSEAPACPVEREFEIEGVLGQVPHSVRYYLGRMHHLVTATSQFNQCSACGPKIVESYKKSGFDFLLQVFNSPNHLESVSGLNKLKENSTGAEIWELSDSEEDDE